MPIPRPDLQGDRVIAHVDLDCFYVQVEQRKQPKLRGLPTAVVQYNDWKGGALIAVSYEARRFGVKRSMRGAEAEMVCPNIQLVQVPVSRGKADLNAYRCAGSEVVSILSTKGRCERASIDEVYLDLTDAAESMLLETPPEALEDIDEEALKSHVLGLSGDENRENNVQRWFIRSDAIHQDKLLACGAIIVAHLRGEVLKETEFTCSAGIAHNKMLAKLASGMHKPAQQTIVPSSAVKDLLASLPVKKITWLWNIARGISGDEVKGRVLPKSHGCGKTFPGPRALKTTAAVESWLNQLCEELSERIQLDMDQNKRVAHTLTLHARAFKTSDVEPHKKFPSKSCPLRYGINKIQEDAKKLFDTGLREFLGSHSNAWRVTSLAISAGKILDTPRTSSISRFFQGKSFSSAISDASNDDIQDDAPSSSIGCKENIVPESDKDEEVFAHGKSIKEDDAPSKDRKIDVLCTHSRKQKDKLLVPGARVMKARIKETTRKNIWLMAIAGLARFQINRGMIHGISMLRILILLSLMNCRRKFNEKSEAGFALPSEQKLLNEGPVFFIIFLQMITLRSHVHLRFKVNLSGIHHLGFVPDGFLLAS